MNNAPPQTFPLWRGTTPPHTLHPLATETNKNEMKRTNSSFAVYISKRTNLTEETFQLSSVYFCSFVSLHSKLPSYLYIRSVTCVYTQTECQAQFSSDYNGASIRHRIAHNLLVNSRRSRSVCRHQRSYNNWP